METTVSRFRYKGKMYKVETPLRRQNVGRLLQRWLCDDIAIRVSAIDLCGPSRGERMIKRVDGYTIKESENAEAEFRTTLRAEEITDLTPMAGGLLLEEGSKHGFVSVQFFDGIPVVNINTSTLQRRDKESITKAVLFSMGRLHIGDRKNSILHRDAHLGNFIIIPNPDDNELLTRTTKRAEIRIVDLEKALIAQFNKKLLEPMAYDLLRAINQLIWDGFLQKDEVLNFLDSYLEGNTRFDRKEVVSMLKESIPKHPKLKAVQELKML
ncbi:MAG: hypothetical protein QW590_01480 [Candidatus Bilamarchaeaceae archaeon]